MMRQTFPPPRNPMAPLFQRAAESLTTSLTVHSAHYYQCTGRHFLNFLDAQHPRVRSLGQIRRDPHILEWFTLLRSRQPALAKLTYSHYVIRLRRIFEELAWTQGIPLLTRLIRADDIPRPDGCLPRPLTAEQDHLIQDELLRRDDWIGNACCCSGTPACGSASASICRSIVCAVSVRIGGPFMCPLASCGRSVSFPSTPSSVESCIVFRCCSLRMHTPLMAFSWPALADARGSATSCVLHCMRSLLLLASGVASSRISFGTLLPLKCSEQA